MGVRTQTFLFSISEIEINVSSTLPSHSKSNDLFGCTEKISTEFINGGFGLHEIENSATQKMVYMK